jgi:sec-independent protein translocase protein TatA
MAIGPWEIVILLLVLVVIFGAARLSQVGGAIGQTVREFRTAVREEPKTPAPPPVICASCQTSNVANNKFCSSCGAGLEAAPPVPAPTIAAAATTCPSCATVNPPGQAFCGQCGTRLSIAA